MVRIICFLLSISLISSIYAQPDYRSWDGFLRKYVSASGEVNYSKIKSNKSELDNIIKSFSTVNIGSSWNKNEQLAYWINAYNAFTIKLIADNYPLSSIQNLDGGKTWDVMRISIGGKKYSLNNIENDIIRKQFKDARIHFAVNCGAKSCPPLLNAAFLPSTLEAQLENQTKKIFTTSKLQQLSASKVKLSKIMDWYASDFGNLIDFINKYSNIKINAKAKIEYLNYDWTLNDSKK